MNKRKLDIKLFKQKQLLRQSQQLGLEMALDLIDTRNKLKEKIISTFIVALNIKLPFSLSSVLNFAL